MDSQPRVFDDTLSLFEENTLNSEIYLQQQTDKPEIFISITKSLYDNVIGYTKDSHNFKSKALCRLLTKGFDQEQIWQQLELQNISGVPYFTKHCTNINLDRVSFGISDEDLNHKTCDKNTNNISDGHGSIDGEEYAFDDDSDSAMDLPKANEEKSVAEHRSNKNITNISDGYSSSDGEEYAFDGDSDSSMDLHKHSQDKSFNNHDKKSTCDDKYDSDSAMDLPKAYEEKSVAKHCSKEKKYATEVDDKFFKVSKLEQFLKLEDLKEERGKQQQDDDDEEIDLFQDIPSEMDDSEEETENGDSVKGCKKSANSLMYEDFFDQPDSADESIHPGDVSEADANDEQKDKVYDTRDYNPAEDNFNHPENECKAVKDSLEIPPKKEPETEKSAFEIEQKKIRKKIQEYERSMLKPLPWQLTGEVSASSRPADSLVHEETDFDSNIKGDLVIDTDLTEKTENIIKMAIMNKAWNDVERKVKTDDIPYKKEKVLEQSKSKKSLAEVYEEDYLNKQQKKKEEEDPKHKEIKKLMDSLFPELHALFSHIPKPPVPEIKVVSNLPAITVEDVAPISISDAALLAPEEVKKMSGPIKGQTERTDTDRKRERRKKKILQKLKQKKSEKQVDCNSKMSSKDKKKQKLETLKKLKQHKNTIIAEVNTGEKIKSSKDFFSRLQDTVNSKVTKAVGNKKQAKKVKLKH